MDQQTVENLGDRYLIALRVVSPGIGVPRIERSKNAWLVSSSTGRSHLSDATFRFWVEAMERTAEAMICPDE